MQPRRRRWCAICFAASHGAPGGIAVFANQASNGLVKKRATLERSGHDERRRPGPRRGHTAARAFEGSPVQFASHAISCFRRSEATVDQLTGPIAMLAM